MTVLKLFGGISCDMVVTSLKIALLHIGMLWLEKEKRSCIKIS